MKTERVIILGAGVSGLAAGIKTQAPIYEANDYAGGICYSYLKNKYRFEIGGGHWVFGQDQKTLNYLNQLSPLNKYQRKSAVFFPENKLYVPYPLQNNINFLSNDVSRKVYEEMKNVNKKSIARGLTQQQWLNINFGKTLCDLFFFPFQKMYTAGLYTKISPQDTYKNPTAQKNGYNDIFAYPKKGLSHLVKQLTKLNKIFYNKRVVKIDPYRKIIFFDDKTKLKYEKIISTLPLNLVIKITKLEYPDKDLPYTSVLVINIGALKGKKCPPHHWLYIPDISAGFYRVGFYSNIDPVFAPNKNRVSIYVERAFVGGNKLTPKMIGQFCKETVKTLQEWDFIGKTEVIDPTFIETAYTWQLPESKVREQALERLSQMGIYQIGRYGRWQFQGILESVKQGLEFSF